MSTSSSSSSSDDDDHDIETGSAQPEQPTVRPKESIEQQPTPDASAIAPSTIQPTTTTTTAPLPSFVPAAYQRRNDDDDDDSNPRSCRARLLFFWNWLLPLLAPLRPRVNYFWIHLGYIIFMTLLGGLILWGIEDGLWYLDAIFVASSAVCVTGLSTVDFSIFKTGSQIMVLIWIQMGGLVFLSMMSLAIRLLMDFWATHHIGEHEDGVAITRQSRRILRLLFFTILGYLVVVELICFIIMGAYLQADDGANAVMNQNGVSNPWWWSLFYTMSAFQDAGFALFASSIVPFSNDQVISLTIAFLIVAGNTLFPVFLRAVLVVMRKVTCNQNMKDDLDELLRNPRTYFYLLFPSFSTWILLGFWLLMTLIEWCIFFVEWDRISVYGSDFAPAIQLMINFVQTVSVRTCGLNNVNIGALKPGHLAFLIVSMYTSAFPYIVTLRSSGNKSRADSASSRVFHWTKHLLARDLIWLYFVIIVITFVEYKTDATDPALVPNSFLSICFEVSSAFGTVGLSTGFPGQNYSYCGSFRGFSKFLIILTILAGRHRGLPEDADHSITPVRKSVDFIRKRSNEDRDVRVSLESSSTSG